MAVGSSAATVAAREALHTHIRDVPDFPSPGVVFKDIAPLLRDGTAFATVVDGLAAHARDIDADVIVGIEARGFLLAAAVGYTLRLGVVPIRKAGKLPGAVSAVSYDLEYGSATLEAQQDAFRPGDRVLLVDDVLATGGTAVAARTLVERSGAAALGVTVLLELGFLGGRARIAPTDVHALLVL